jgi:hypothetical protein
MRRHFAFGHSEIEVATRSHALRWIIAAACLAVALALGFWYPYDFSLDPARAKPQLNAFTTALFAPMYWGSEFDALSAIVLKTLTFALLSGCLGMAIRCMPATESMRKLLRFASIAACSAFGLLIELGQILLSGHTPHVTDAFLYSLGAIAGIAIVSSMPSPHGLRRAKGQAATHK